MVSMDRKQRSAVFSFWRRVFLCLTTFSIVYIGAIRPIRVWSSTQVLNPLFSCILDNKEAVIQVSTRTIQIKNISNQYINISIPFGFYFILPCALFFIMQRKRYIKNLVFYHCILLLLKLGFGIIFAYNFSWPIFLMSLIGYLDFIIFLILILLSIIALKKQYSIIAYPVIN